MIIMHIFLYTYYLTEIDVLNSFHVLFDHGGATMSKVYHYLFFLNSLYIYYGLIT